MVNVVGKIAKKKEVLKIYWKVVQVVEREGINLALFGKYSARMHSIVLKILKYY